jgi:hypothetical protein
MSYSPPPGFTFLHQTRFGTAWYIRSNGPNREPDYLMVQDMEATLDRNQAMANHNDGWSIEGRSKADKLLRRQATVPWGVITDWKENRGIDYWSRDPDVQRKIDSLLDSSDFSKLRTAHYFVGKRTREI